MGVIILNLQMDGKIAEQYVSNTQKIRVITETWLGENMFCPYCGNSYITHFENNKPVADFFCPHCEEEWKFLKRITPKYYENIHVYGFEVWNSKENQKIMDEFKDKLNISKDSGIPLTIIEDKYYIGYDESYNDEILKLIKNNHKNSKDIYLNKNL